MEKKRVLMAMSGGIDSTVAAMLLLEQGYELVGVTYRTFDNISRGCMEKEKGCCSVDSLFEAKRMAQELGFEHHILDIRQEFKDTVITNFIGEYLQGRTPNPCVICNSTIKWGKLIETANEMRCDYIRPLCPHRSPGWTPVSAERSRPLERSNVFSLDPDSRKSIPYAFPTGRTD